MISNKKLKDKAGLITKNTDMANIPSENTSLTINNNRTTSSIAEIEKWKKFGYLMAESYDELKKENEKIKQEREKDRKIVHALKDQVDKLKLIIKARRTDEGIESSERKRDDLEKDRQIELMREIISEKDRLIE
jgi:hypothetical protein